MMTKTKVAFALALLMVVLAGAATFTASEDSDAAIDLDKIGYGASDDGVMKVIYSETTHDSADAYLLGFALTKEAGQQVDVYVDDVKKPVPLTIKDGTVVGYKGVLTTGTHTLRIVTSDSKYDESCTLYVGKLAISEATASIAVGNTKTLSVSIDYGASSGLAYSDVTWESSAATVATVTNGGVVTGVSDGTADITATFAKVGGGTTEVKCTVTVSGKAVTGVTLPGTMSLNTGASGSLTATISPADAADKAVTWTIVEGDVVTLSSTTANPVTVTAGNTTGTAKIKVTTHDGAFTAECTVTVSTSPGPGPGPGPTPTTYTVTFTAGTGGTVLPTQVTVNSGSAISVSGNVMTIGTGTSARTITATPAAGYELDAWSKTSGTVTSNMTITVSFKAPELPITKEVPNGSVTIPASVVKDLDIKDAAKLVLAIDKVTPTLSNIPSDAVCFAITLKYDGKVLTAFSSDIEVLLKYVPPTGADVSKLKVYYISDDGRIVENMNAAYSAVRGGMVFGTKHLSVFVVTQNSIEPVPAVLTSISVKTAPSKVAYTAGDKFDPTGLVLSLKYDDGTSKDLAYKGNESKFSFSPDLKTALKVTDKTVTITYEGKTTTQSITVSESPSGGDDNSMMIIIIVIIVLLLIVAIAFFVMKMRIKP